MMLQAHFSDRVKVKNWARNGRSTRRFIDRGLVGQVAGQYPER
jgi:hypothetical protein